MKKFNEFVETTNESIFRKNDVQKINDEFDFSAICIKKEIPEEETRIIKRYVSSFDVKLIEIKGELNETKMSPVGLISVRSDDTVEITTIGFDKYNEIYLRCEFPKDQLTGEELRNNNFYEKPWKICVSKK